MATMPALIASGSSGQAFDHGGQVGVSQNGRNGVCFTGVFGQISATGGVESAIYIVRASNPKALQGTRHEVVRGSPRQ